MYATMIATVSNRTQFQTLLIGTYATQFATQNVQFNQMTVSKNRAKGFGSSVSDVETHMEWRLKAATCTNLEGNPFGLDDTLLEETKQLAPPLHKLDEWSIPEEEYEYHGLSLIHI